MKRKPYQNLRFPIIIKDPQQFIKLRASLFTEKNNNNNNNSLQSIFPHIHIHDINEVLVQYFIGKF